MKEKMPGDDNKKSFENLKENSAGLTNKQNVGQETSKYSADAKVKELLEIIAKWRDAISAIALRGALSNNREVMKIATALWDFLSDLIVSHTVVTPDNNPDPVISGNPNCKCEQIDNEWRDVIDDLNSRITALERNYVPRPAWSPINTTPWD